MRSISSFVCILSFIFLFVDLSAQTTWKLVKDEDGILVYTRKPINSKLKEIKIEAVISSSLNEMMAALNDIEAHKDWVYKTPVSNFLRSLSEQSMVYYVRLDLPFPAQDRDILIEYSWSQNPDTKVVKTLSKAHDIQLIEEQEDIIRVHNFESIYILSPLGPNKLKLEYTAKIDPAGNLPSWLINLGVTVGPTKSMKALFKLIESGKYQKQKVHGINEKEKL